MAKLPEEQANALTEWIARAMAYRSVGDPHAVDIHGNQRWTWYRADAEKFVEIFGHELATKLLPALSTNAPPVDPTAGLNPDFAWGGDG